LNGKGSKKKLLGIGALRVGTPIKRFWLNFPWNLILAFNLRIGMRLPKEINGNSRSRIFFGLIIPLPQP